MTITIVAVGLAATFVVGFLLGDRRAVKHCNGILDDHWRELMKAIRDDRIDNRAPDSDDLEIRSAGPTVH